jgi:heptaprenyl diphosphate synthase
MIPKPLPFMRIGLANVPLILALDILAVQYFALLVMLKVFGQAIITGTFFSYVFVFSLASTCSATAAMYLLRRLLRPKYISFIGVSVIGACVSNGSQLLLAWFFIFGPGIRFLIPLFLGAGLVTGLSLGVFCETFSARSQWYQSWFST